MGHITYLLPKLWHTTLKIPKIERAKKQKTGSANFHFLNSYQCDSMVVSITKKKMVQKSLDCAPCSLGIQSLYEPLQFCRRLIILSLFLPVSSKLAPLLIFSCFLHLWHCSAQFLIQYIFLK